MRPAPITPSTPSDTETGALPAAPLTRRAALAAERTTSTRRRQRRSRQCNPPGRPVLRLMPSASRPRTALLGAAAVTALVVAVTAPTQVAVATTPHGAWRGASGLRSSQEFHTARTSIVASERDGYTITPPPSPRQPLGSSPAVHGSAVPGAGAGTPETIVAAGPGLIRWPVAGPIRISSPFGPRVAPCAGCTSFHEGADIIPGYGTPIGAVAAGTVRFSGVSPTYGQYVVLDHHLDGMTISTLYAHMIYGSSPLQTGQTVTAGQLVGRVGSTGDSTGPHLHLEVRLRGTTPIDPIAWLTQHVGRTQ